MHRVDATKHFYCSIVIISNILQVRKYNTTTVSRTHNQTLGYQTESLDTP